MSRIVETVYNSRDNTIDLQLLEDDAPYPLGNVTKMELDVEGTDINSDDSPLAFDWDTGVEGKVILSLGEEGLSVGTYRTYLTVFAPTYTDGIVWGMFYLKVRDI